MIDNKVTSKSPLGGLGVILIADSGSTKTHWCLVQSGSVVREVFTDGINPFTKPIWRLLLCWILN